jgi:cell division protein FtsB
MQKRFVLVPVAAAVFILYFTVFGERGLLRINHLHRDRDEMQKRFMELKSENDKLKREISALQSDRRYLESIARRDFGFVRGNEVIYQFAPQAPQDKAQQGKAPQAAQDKAAQDKAEIKSQQPADRKLKYPPAAAGGN